MRRKAKTANFGIIYGISVFGLAERLGIPRSESKELIDGYFSTYPRIKEYMEESIKVAKECRAKRNQCPYPRERRRYHQTSDGTHLRTL